MTYPKVVTQPPQALMRRKTVQALTGLSRSGLYKAIRNGLFPKPIKIGLRAVAWKASDIYTWIDSKINGESK